MTYQVSFTGTAERRLLKIPNGNIRDTIIAKAEGLKRDPEKQGKALLYSLAGLRSISAAGRYRIIYRVERSQVVVMIVAVAKRKEGDPGDVYELTKKLLRSGLI